MKAKEELNALKEEVENLNKKLADLTEDELAQVTGGKIVSAVFAGSETQNPFDTSFSKLTDNNTIYEHHLYEEETKEAAEKKFFGK